MSYKEDILKAFLEFDPELVKQMEECKHAGDNHINPYHLENSVYCHTLLTYNQADNSAWGDLIMALCHDIGKVYTRQIRDNGKIVFFGHSEASIQKTIDFCHYLYDNNIIDRSQLISFIDNCLGPMSNHTLYYQNIEKAEFISNGDSIKLEKLQKISEVDTLGSICKDKKNIGVMEYDKFTKKEYDQEKPTVFLWTGVPGSGKDYLAYKNGCPIVSFDDIRVKTFKANANIVKHNDNTIYKKAFEYCNVNNVNLMKLLVREAKDYLDKGISINVCNTSLTRKSRRAVINSLGTKYNYVVLQVIAPSSVIMERNANRKSKTIPVGVINDMMLKQSICTNFEKNINDIIYIYNDSLISLK